MGGINVAVVGEGDGGGVAKQAEDCIIEVLPKGQEVHFTAAIVLYVPL